MAAGPVSDDDVHPDADADAAANNGAMDSPAQRP
jgi:hypothetical protein